MTLNCSFTEASAFNVEFERTEEFGAAFGEAQTIVDPSKVPVYSGAYVATPSAETQIFPTGWMMMRMPFIINPIPSNYGKIDYDGYTITVS